MSTPREMLFELPAPGQWRPRTEQGARALDAIACDPDGTLLVSDFDGTLAAIVPDPRQARIDDGSRAHLAALAPRLGQLVILTGRGVQVVRELAGFEDTPGFEQLVVLGQYGQEQWDAATGELTVPPIPAAVAEAHAALRRLLDQAPAGAGLDGVVLEDKGRAIGVHTRRAADPEAALEWLRPRLATIATAPGLTLEPGRQVVELRSSTTTKGDALAALVERYRPRVVVMMGDDLGDLPAFAVVRSLTQQGIQGICVVATSAEQPGLAEQGDVLCSGSTGIAAWLRSLRERVEQTA